MCKEELMTERRDYFSSCLALFHHCQRRMNLGFFLFACLSIKTEPSLSKTDILLNSYKKSYKKSISALFNW